MTLNVAEIGEQMINAVIGVLKGQTPGVLNAAKNEFQLIAQQIVAIGEGVSDGSIRPEAAPIMLNMQKESWKGAVIEATGLAEIMVENALNAAINVIKSPVNTAIGFALIP